MINTLFNIYPVTLKQLRLGGGGGDTSAPVGGEATEVGGRGGGYFCPCGAIFLLLWLLPVAKVGTGQQTSCSPYVLVKS